jgi:hypothetical protein
LVAESETVFANDPFMSWPQLEIAEVSTDDEGEESSAEEDLQHNAISLGKRKKTVQHK